MSIRRPWLLDQSVVENTQPGAAPFLNSWSWSLPPRRLDITDVDELAKVLSGDVGTYQLRGPQQRATSLDELQGASLPQLSMVEVTAGTAVWTFNRGYSHLFTADTGAVDRCRAMRDRYLQLGHPRRDPGFGGRVAVIGAWVAAFIPLFIAILLGQVSAWVLPTALVGWIALGVLAHQRFIARLRPTVNDGFGVLLDQRPRLQVRFDAEAARQRRVVFWQTFAAVTPLAGFFGWLGNYLTG